LIAELLRAVRDYGSAVGDAWQKFWFTPRRPHVLAGMRIATGAMMVYIHLVWGMRLEEFLGPHAWIDRLTSAALHAGDFTWTPLWWIESSFGLWTYHLCTLAVTLAFACGFATRLTAPLAWLLQLTYIHRLTGALFGLDQIVSMLAMYLMLAPCGSLWSIDARWRRHRGRSSWWLPDATPSVAANIATRLIQLHLCVIYLFGGLSKLRGEMWWDGTAMWFSVANFEYQSLDLTWLARYPALFAGLTHLTVFWESFYAALVWPRLTRPWVLAMAVAVHGGIALGLGMITFGTMMIVANAAFLEPAWLFDQTAAREPVHPSRESGLASSIPKRTNPQGRAPARG
jgi:hypothetical protein